MLNEQDIDKFKELYKTYSGKEIDISEAIEKGNELVRLMQLVYKPITKGEYAKFKNKKD